jgi:hypothetical protein
MATKTVDFETANIAECYLAYIKNHYGMRIRQDAIGDLYRVIFNTITTVLKYQRNKKNPHIGFKLKNEAGDFVFGALLDFHASEGDNDDMGNWTLSFTFNEDDMSECSETYDNYDDMFFAIACGEIRSTMYADFTDNASISEIFTAAFEVLKEQLDAASNTGEEYEIVMPGIFNATVAFEDGQKVYCIIPGANIKQLVKDDKGQSKDSNTVAKAA